MFQKVINKLVDYLHTFYNYVVIRLADSQNLGTYTKSKGSELTAASVPLLMVYF